MRRDDYINAVDKLKFQDISADKIRAGNRRSPGSGLLRRGLIAAVLGCCMITTAFGAVAVLRQYPGEVKLLGTDGETMTDAQYMTFSMSGMDAEVKKHHMELDPRGQYDFRHGMLWNRKTGYLQITEDYQLKPVEMNQVRLTLEKNDRTYVLELDYIQAGSCIISNHRSLYHTDENGEVLLNATDGNSSQWPVYFNPATGTIRDALPDWTAADFEGRGCDGSELKDGILITTIVNDGLPDAWNILYWIAPEAEEPRIIQLPGSGTWYAENDTIYYQNDVGQLYCMDESFEFQLICGYQTMDYLQDGLLTVSAQGKLGILDAYMGELYAFEDIKASKTDTLDYHAIRYGSSGTIALTQIQWRHDPERYVLTNLGVLDTQSAQLKLLEIENDYDGYRYNWLDENRLAVIYRSGGGQFLCIYEFDR